MTPYKDVLSTDYVNSVEDVTLVNCYLSIYFDIAEIERRQMVSRLRSSIMSEESIELVYHEMSKELGTTLARFERETRKGHHLTKVKEWNDYVHDHLGLDNMAIFHFSKK